MNATQPYKILAFYHFGTIENPLEEVKAHKKFFETRDITSRIYINEEGINGQMCARCDHAEEYMNWLRERSPFQLLDFKIDPYHEHVFPRKTVKYRKKLVGGDSQVDMSIRGKHLSPQEWKEMLEKSNDHILLDVRNDYEWEVGHFEGAEMPPCKNYRDFEKYADNLKKQQKSHSTPVMMYCTGGIRCELYSSLLKAKGFDRVYQLQGGVINYGKKEGSSHWLGKLFVFDDRIAVPISDDEAPVVSTCHHCNAKTDAYYNCANMDCNFLFLSCDDCIEKHVGCCKKECSDGERVRPYHQNDRHKPFRRKHLYTHST